MSHILIFGLGYTAGQLAERLAAGGWRISATRRAGGADAIGFDDERAVIGALGSATHILSSVPPDRDGDPVLARYGDAIAAAPARWTGYLSSTGVYGDTNGAWVDEAAPVGAGRRNARAAADLAWQASRGDVRVFRLPGIYGPTRSPLDRLAAGQAQAIHAPGQMFSRIHVDDIVSAVIAGFGGRPGAYNIADDQPAEQHVVTAYAAACLGLAPPPLVPLADAALSPAARAFYSENRRIANRKARRELGWSPAYPDYRAGLRALSATIRPRIASSAPEIDSAVQR